MDLIPNFTYGYMSAIVGQKSPKTLQDIGPAFEVRKVILSLDTDKCNPQVEIFVNDHGKTYSFIMAVEELFDVKSVCYSLCKRGIIMDTQYKKPITRLIIDGITNCKSAGLVEYRHNNLGWSDIGGKEIFLYNKNIILGQPSVFNRQNFAFSRGNEKTYKQFLSDTVYPVDTLALAMSIGYSAVVISRLKDKVDLGTVVVNLCSESSKGKTTVEELMVSAFASPIASDDGLMKTFLATESAIYDSIKGINGLPIVIDDTSNAEINLQKLVYSLSSGTPKKRCNSIGEITNNNVHWSGVVVISSETSMQESFTLDGAKARVIDARDITWTPDAKTANLIKSTVRKHYGHTGIEFANYIANISIEELYEKYLLAETAVNAIMVKRDKLSDRLAMKYAAIYLTVQLMNDCFKLKLSEERLIGILLTSEQENMESRDSAEEALSKLKDFVFENKNKFNWFNRHSADLDLHTGKFKDPMGALPDYKAKGEDFGTIEYSENGCLLYVSCSALNTFFYEQRIKQKLQIKKKWKADGIIVCDGERYDTKYMKRRVVKFIFQNGLDFDIEYPDRKKAVTAIVSETPKSHIEYDDSEELKNLFDGEQDD